MTITNIIKYGRVPHFNANFPLVLFWSQKVVALPLHIGFYQINLFKQAIKYDSLIHHYENEVYKNSSDYFIDLMTLYAKKDTYKLVRNPYTRAVSSFFSLIAPPYIETQHGSLFENFIMVMIFVISLFHLKSFSIT